MSIQAAAVDVAATFAFGRTFSATLGHRAKTTLILTNTGNVAATGTARILLVASTDQSVDPADTTLAGPIIRKLRVEPGKTLRINLPFTTPSLPFNYLLAQVAPDTQPVDQDAFNSTAIAAFTPDT